MINDSLSYISIGRLYASGEFDKAINSYWSPVYSLISGAFFLLNINEILGLKFINVISIIPTIIVSRKILQLIINNELIIFGASVSISIILIQASIANLTPDVLLIPFILYIVYQLLKEIYYPLTCNIYTCSIAAALAFLIKQYFLYYFLISLTVCFILNFSKYTQIGKKLLVNYFKTVLLFLVIISPWIILISSKENRFTISTAGTYNISNYLNPDREGLFYLKDSLLSLPYQEAYSYWNEPNKIPIEQFKIYKAFSSSKNRIYQFNRMNINYQSTFDFIDFLFSYHLIFFLILILFFTFNYMILNKSDYKIFTLLFILFIIYLSGYIFLVVDYRYIYAAIIILILISSCIVSKISENVSANFIITLLITIISSYYLSIKSFEKIIEFNSVAYDKLRKSTSIKSLITTNSNCCNYDLPEQEVYSCYNYNLKYFGSLFINQNIEFKIEELRRKKIKYVFTKSIIDSEMKKYLNYIATNENDVNIYEVVSI